MLRLPFKIVGKRKAVLLRRNVDSLKKWTTTTRNGKLWEKDKTILLTATATTSTATTVSKANQKNRASESDKTLWHLFGIGTLDSAIQDLWVQQSNRNPKPGIIAIREGYQREYGGELTLDPFRNCLREIISSPDTTDSSPCYEIMYSILEENDVLSDLGLSEFVPNGRLLFDVRHDFYRFGGDLEDWYSYWIVQDPNVLRTSEVPYTFSQAITSSDKTYGGLVPMAFMANPYFGRDELYERLATPNFLNLAATKYCSFKAGDEILVLGAFPAALKLRLLELPSTSEWQSMIESEPSLLRESRPLSEWGIYGHPNETLFTDFFQGYNDDFLNQTVRFEMEMKEANDKGGANVMYQMIQPGNLTENTAGRTHEYYVVSPYPRDEEIQTVFREQMENADIWARTAAAAIQADNPCRNAAGDNDLYLYVIGIVAATCGGMQTVLATVHQSLHFFTGRFWARGRPRDSFFLWRLVPTYELVISILGLCILILLYYPILLQLRIEQEVADFETQATDLDVEYTSDHTVSVVHLGRFALVTLVHVTSHCQNSRVTLLRSLLIIGIIFGLLMNALFLASVWTSVWTALRRYLRILGGSHHDDEEETKLECITPADSSLRVLELPFSPRRGERTGQSEESTDSDRDMVSLTELHAVDGSSEEDVDDESVEEKEAIDQHVLTVNDEEQARSSKDEVQKVLLNHSQTLRTDSSSQDSAS